ncbi:MAG: hypothetical protein HKP61_05050 [Dactylosporangium sp.]|nr:hypothetical protein [Dactylosporangium sp.]NNJ60314.1 hypothetical protein [Dactylosporangium sp.]
MSAAPKGPGDGEIHGDEPVVPEPEGQPERPKYVGPTAPTPVDPGEGPEIQGYVGPTAPAPTAPED